MRYKYLFTMISVVALLLLGAAAATAQVGELRGHVVITQADGTTAPLPGATIDVFRTDISGKWETKTDKRGDFVFAGLPYVGTYVVAVSAPNASPDVRGGVKVGHGDLPVITLSPGDGKRFTPEEAKTQGAGSAARGGGNQGASDKANREEMIKKNREIDERNKKVEDSNKIIAEKFKLGNNAVSAAQSAVKANNYDEGERQFTEAIKQFDEGLAAEPAHPGAPSLLTNKAVAQKERGVLRFNSTITSDKYKSALRAGDASANAMLEPAKQDWKDAFESVSKAVQILKTQERPTDLAQLANFKQNEYFALMVRVDAATKFVTKVDQSKVDVGIGAYQEYLAVETDPAKKVKAQHDLAQMLFDASAFDRAQAEYEKMLAENPDDVDALLNMGMILFNQGALKDGEGKKDEAKAKYQEAANYLQHFVDKAPDTNKFKADAKAVLDELKNQQNVKAEKTTTTTPTRRKRP